MVVRTASDIWRDAGRLTTQDFIRNECIWLNELARFIEDNAENVSLYALRDIISNHSQDLLGD